MTSDNRLVTLRNMIGVKRQEIAELERMRNQVESKISMARLEYNSLERSVRCLEAQLRANRWIP